MDVLAETRTSDTEANVRKDGEDVVVTISGTEHRFKVVAQSSGRIQLLHGDGTNLVVEVNGTEVKVDGVPYPMKLRKAPPKVAGATRGAGAGGGVTKIKPPMPGKIVKIAVAPGTHVQPGEVLVILEAMKMQNEIVSPVEGTVRSVSVAEGETIDSKRVICEIE